MRTPTPAACSLLLLPVLLCTAPAAAKSKRQARYEAKAALEEARRHIEAQDYGEAAAALHHARETLEEAGLKVPVKLHFYLAHCYEELGQVTAALRYHTKFLSLVGRRRRHAGAREESQAAKKRLQALVARTKLAFDVKPAGTEVRVDLRTVGHTPLEPVTVAPGPHQVTLWAEGHEPVSFDVDAAAGLTVAVVHALQPEEPDAPAAPAVVAEPGGLGAPVWATIGLAALAVGAGAGAGWLLVSARDHEAEGEKLTGTTLAVGGGGADATEARVSALYDAAAARRSGSLGLTVAAVGALAGIGVVWLLADDAPAGPRPAAGAGSGGAVLGLAVEW